MAGKSNKAFADAYAKLNDEQKKAVDIIDGPVMVVAGPGTGKTQLLSTRVANLLYQTDVLPENILCLTFSETGARTMRERLSGIIGPDAYKVGVSTFHGFGSEVINRYPEYFYNGAAMKPADDLAQHRLFELVLSGLPANNYFTMRFDDEYTMLASVRNMVSDIKRAGLSPEEVRNICADNKLFIDFAEPLFAEAFNGTINKHTLDACEQLVLKLREFNVDRPDIRMIGRLHDVCQRQLSVAIHEASLHPRVTPPLTAFKTSWRDSKQRDGFALKVREQTAHLRDAAEVYDKYQAHLASEHLFDYDDMIVQVVHELERNDELRSSLQEQFQYLLIDEFQDTNLAQLRILQVLCDNPVNEGQPNIMVVGDDDQTIYAFQGAEIGNMLDFSKLYPNRERIVLTTNYRSAQKILDEARAVILQGENRLEHQDPTLVKKLTADPDNPKPGTIERHEFPVSLDEHVWIVKQVKLLLSQGVSPTDIALISAKHKQLQAIAPFFLGEQIPVAYEKRENVLTAPHVVVLLQLSRVIEHLRQGQPKPADALLPELLTHPMWHVHPNTIWKLSLAAYKATDTGKFWLEQMLHADDTDVRRIAAWLIDMSQRANHETLEPMLDRLIGIHETKKGEYVSPYHEFYFATENLQSGGDTFVNFLGALTTLRGALREYEPAERLMLHHLLEFVDRANATDTHITYRKGVGDTEQAVSLLSGHGAKGLEFSDVFLLSCNQDTWVKSGGFHQLSYPVNVAQLQRGGHDLDDRLRLFYVALTRAKQSLIMTRSTHDSVGKELMPIGFLADETAHKLAPITIHNDRPKVAELLQAIQVDWHGIHKEALTDSRDALAAILEDYQLSVTALDNFLDLEHGGPQSFLERSLLRFPSAMSPNQAFGSAVHHTLQAAHVAVRKNEPKTSDELLKIFQSELIGMRLNARDERLWLERGNEFLISYFDQRLETFSPGQLAERDFHNQACVVGAARLTGKLDLMETHENTIVVTDYKTGTPESRWSLSDVGSNAKLYRYRRQLTFYKLLVESSAEYGRRYKVNKGILSFVQPTKDTGKLLDLPYDIGPDETERLRMLIQAVWQKIMTLDFPETSAYDPTLDGIMQFEQDLLEGKL